jgi:hypothetical protein
VGLLTAYSSGFAQEPKLQDAGAYCERGRDFLKERKYDKAIANYTDEAIQLDPK